jgi:hypothetical protein
MYWTVKAFTKPGCDLHLYMLGNKMNLEGLTPEQRRFITDLSKRIHVLESKLVILQAKMVRIDPHLTATLAKNFKHLNLN